MQEMTCAPFKFPVFEFLNGKGSGIAGVWQISLPTLTWKQEKAERERNTFLHKLVEKFPFCSLWISDWASEQAEGWHSLDGSSLLSRLEQLNEGGWALFFFETSPT